MCVRGREREADIERERDHRSADSERAYGRETVRERDYEGLQ